MRRAPRFGLDAAKKGQMVMAKKPTKAAAATGGEILIAIPDLELSTARFRLLGESAMIMHRFSQKAWQELFCPGEETNRAARQSTLKHDPQAEYCGAFYRNRDPARPTLFHIPSGMVHGAIASAALDLPGVAKAKIERLTRVINVNIDFYGVPQIYCAMVRNSGMTRTPDVRTRPIFPEWACEIEISFPRMLISERDLARLVSAAGRIIGIGDWRGEKGGPFGSWVLPDRPEREAKFARIVKTQGRAAQTIAFDKPVFYDQDTEDLLHWFEIEVRRREKDGLLDRSYSMEDGGGFETLRQQRVVIERNLNHGEAGEFVGEETLAAAKASSRRRKANGNGHAAPAE